MQARIIRSLSLLLVSTNPSLSVCAKCLVCVCAPSSPPLLFLLLLLLLGLLILCVQHTHSNICESRARELQFSLATIVSRRLRLAPAYCMRLLPL